MNGSKISDSKKHSTIEPRQVTLTCQDGHNIVVDCFSATQEIEPNKENTLQAENTPTVKGQVIIASAIGVPKQFYRHFARFLCQQGYHCFTLDYRGTGQSKDRAKLHDIKISDWGLYDLPHVIEFVDQQSPALPIFLVGHSIGGQLLGMIPNAEKIKAAIMVGSSCPHWSQWPFPNKLQILLASHLIFPLVSLVTSKINQEFPAKALGVGSFNIPSSVSQQWGQWLRDKNYLFSEKFKLPQHGYRDLNLPILAYAFDDDSIAPVQNVDRLLSFYLNAQKERKFVQHQQYSIGSIGHSGFFREKAKESLWQEALVWLNQQSIN